jgi:hypothetical protein
MTATYEKIATNTLGSAAATVTFSTISGAYTDLVLIIAAGNSTTANDIIQAQFNSDTGSNYSFTQILGNGSSATSGRSSNNTAMRFGICSNNAETNAIIQIQNYSNTTTYKSSLARINNPNVNLYAVVNLWRSTSAITSILLKMESGGNFNSGSTFTLYGIKAE